MEEEDISMEEEESAESGAKFGEPVPVPGPSRKARIARTSLPRIARIEDSCTEDDDAGMTSEGDATTKQSYLFNQSATQPQEIHLGMTEFTEAVPTLTYLEYPGKVVNFDNAVVTLGGIGIISQTFANQRDKLELKFRPGDPYCNPINADKSTAGGYLFRIRRKKQKVTETETEPVDSSLSFKIALAALDGPIRISCAGTESEAPYMIKGLCEPSLTGDSIQQTTETTNQSLIRRALQENDRMVAEEMERSMPIGLKNSNSKKRFLKQPIGDPVFRKAQERELARTSDFQVQLLGRVNTAYTFRRGQLCDYQYLPTKFVKGKQVAMLHKILPVFNEPDKNVQYLSENIESETQTTKTPLFLIPSFFSRVDRPVATASSAALTDEGQRLLALSCAHEVNFEELIDAEGFLKSTAAVSGARKQDSDFIVVPMRSKRIIFSHFCNFRATDAEWFADPMGDHVPKDVMPGAMQDIEKKGFDSAGLLDSLRALFEARPIWSRQALEVETKRPHETMKYLLPAVSYFAVNGPWRTFWIRLGYDPRNHKESFEYQLLDYRTPYVYRTFSKYRNRQDESNSRYKPHMIPPKLQMFYQLCDVHIKEIEEIKDAIKTRVRTEQDASEFTYSPKFGFLDEETLEYCRHCIGRCVEEVLKQQGKITAITLPQIDLLPGGLVPKEIMRVNIANRKAYIPSRRHRRYGKGRFSEFPPGRARRNSASSSVNDLEIDRDEYTKPDSEGSEEEEDMEFPDEDEDSDADMTAAEWGMMDPDADDD